VLPILERNFFIFFINLKGNKIRLAAWFRYKYRHLSIGAYASSPVLNAVEDF
jgi:hypothetical protein